MSKKTRRTILILVLVSLFICACPGIFLASLGVEGFVEAVSLGPVIGQDSYVVDLILNGGLVCVSILLILIPVVLFLVWLLNRKPKELIVKIEPTGASEDDPIPPTS